MATRDDLISKFGEPNVRLETVCQEYFGINADDARRKAARNELPVPTFRLSPSQKAPLYVLVDDLAALIDEKARSAKEAWGRGQV